MMEADVRHVPKSHHQSDKSGSKWIKHGKLTVNSAVVSGLEECPLSLDQHGSFPRSSRPRVSSLLFSPLQSECNQLWHEKTRSLSVRTLLVFCWQSSTDSPPPPPPQPPKQPLPPSPPPPPCLPSLTSTVLMNIKMPLGPQKHLCSLGWQGLALRSCTLSPPSADYCSPLGLCSSRCEK